MGRAVFRLIFHLILKTMKKRRKVLCSSILLSKFANSNIYQKGETIKILDGCLDIVDGHFVYFVSEFR